MTHFYYKQNQLWVEKVPVIDIIKTVQTPCYLYSHAALSAAWHTLNDALSHPHLICYAVKANSNLAILQILTKMGSGFDIVSKGELFRVLKAGSDPRKIVFSGVGKTPEEIHDALKAGIACFNVESESEILLLNQIATHLNQRAPIALRINPNIDPQSHPYISTGLKESKFGIAIEKAFDLYQHASTLSHLEIKGIACHIGSQLLCLSPLLQALGSLLDLTEKLKESGISLTHLDLGGGLGVSYRDETPPSLTTYAKALCTRLASYPTLQLILAPGRAITAKAGILVTQVLSLKSAGEKHFCIVDAAMNDLIRPVLYNAWHEILPLLSHPNRIPIHCDVVGQVCESADFLGKDRLLTVQPGEYLAICTAGAYGFVMSSNYNSRPRAPEVMVKEEHFQLVRQRETLEQLWEHEFLSEI